MVNTQLTMPDLKKQLATLRRRFPTILFVASSLIFDDDFCITPEGGLDALGAIAEAVRPSVIFYYFMNFTQDSFEIQPLEPADEDGLPIRPAVDVSKHALMRPYNKRLGEAQSLTVYFLYESHKITVTVFADWNDDFQAACGQAYDGELQRQEARQSEAMLQRRQAREVAVSACVARLQTELPEDDEFCRLAREARPRITDLRKQAEKVLGAELWHEHQGSLFPAVRRIADEIKAAAREARRRKSPAGG